MALALTAITGTWRSDGCCQATHTQLAGRAVELDRVRQQVEQRLLEARGVGRHVPGQAALGGSNCSTTLTPWAKTDGAEIHPGPSGPTQSPTGSDAKACLVANTEEVVARSVFGAPTCFVGDAMFFGQDRLGLRKRGAGLTPQRDAAPARRSRPQASLPLTAGR